MSPDAGAGGGARLTVDVGNRQTRLAAWRGDRAAHDWSLGTAPERTRDEWTAWLRRLLADGPLAAQDVEAIALACVVPAVAEDVAAALAAVFGRPPMVVGPGVRTGLRIRTEDPREVGPDRVANAVAAVALLGAPVLVLDLGTAVTVDVIGDGGDYLGALIAPGIELAAEALSARTSGRLRAPSTPPARAIGSSTADGLRSGLVFGFAGQVEGLLAQARAALGAGDAQVVVTGEPAAMARLLVGEGLADRYEPLLTHRGLLAILERTALA